MSMTLEQQRDIIQAAIEGRVIEVCIATVDAPLGEWKPVTPCYAFDFYRLEYRIAPPALRPHWPAVIYIKQQSRWIVSDRLYDSVGDAMVAERSSGLTGEIRLATEYPPVMLP